MSVPSHNLYDFVHQVTEKRHWLVYFWPWGERDLANGTWYHKDFELVCDPIRGISPDNLVASRFFPWNTIKQNTFLVRHLQSVLFCHDQEPLNWDHYLDSSPFQQTLIELKKNVTGIEYLGKHMRLNVLHSWQRHWILLHSELNSPELEKYQQNGYMGAYWWSHAVISRDWYRYAEHDPALCSLPAQKTFLIYCRDTTGSRTYRKDFLTQISDLNSHCQIGSVSGKTATSDASAEYDALDFNSTCVSVVLETVFDQRIHLTEKILRPIACGHPFILAAGPGSLRLLRHYGFKTFDPWIDESYDLEQDPAKRLSMIVREMRRLAKADRHSFIEQCRAIAHHNKQRFFSADFLSQVRQELADNVRSAHEKTQGRLDPSMWLEERRLKREQKSLPPDGPAQKELLKLARWVRLNSGSFEQYQSHQHCLDDKSSTNGDDI